ncbi:hypothetical protein [Nocardioides sp. BYT-33-1]|uniref:hypothetical protein n=1 Tax=Nocardioides sp. BYT-33-1 TaxID=3416952 RepID=UPI003F52AE4A
MTRQYLEDAVGPDGIRVTIALEPAVDQLIRANDRLGGSFLLRALSGRGQKVVQQMVYGGAWVVDVETDAGRRVRIRVPDHGSALALAKETWRDVDERGVVAVAELG